jgi:hypothetical protein
MKLRELQEAIWKHVTLTGPTDVAASACVSEATVEALELYRQDYFGRLYQAFRVAYAQTHQHLGEAQFRGLLADFLRREPPRSPAILEVLADFPAFVARFVPEEPALVERVHSEWLQHLAASREER